jgi:uncharacterized protein (DUF2062 family)
MLGIIRQFARALTGKVDPLEFALGILFGILLGVIPMHEIDPGSGFLGLNGLWLLSLTFCLVLKASIPVGILFAAFAKLMAILFLDAAAVSLGQGMLDDTLPQDIVVGFSQSWPSLQLHTYWGFGTAVLALAIGVVMFLLSYLTMRSKLPVWRERFGRSRLAKALGGFFLFRLIGRLIA